MEGSPLAAPHTVFVCQACGAQSPRWLGRCPDCGAWNSYFEERLASRTRGTGQPGRDRARVPEAAPITEVSSVAERRLSTGIVEFDRALGGGFVAGGVTLLTGEPGIGKSTLLLQVAHAVAASDTVLYVAGEESPQQIRLRAERLGALAPRIRVLPETHVTAVAEAWKALRPGLVVVDSIQTLADAELESPPGSVSQVRAAAGRLIALAKESDVPLVLVGHVTKEGSIAGPKVLEHAVDTVLYFEGERHAAYRLVRATKNRFGAANEVGCFEMRESGLVEVPNPSAWFLAERADAPGAVVAACVEGTRPLLVEVQALVSDARYGAGRRTASGMDANRLALLLAVLERRCGLAFGDQDAYLKVSGGARLDEPAADLAAALALASSFLDRPIPPDVAVFGEVGLGGEVRGVQHAAQRVREARRLGFARVVLPAANESSARLAETQAAELIPIRRLSDAIDAVLR
ncbi:MAG: DNA repair protein RadA [Clostridia bacterium]|nr:DNA repair protein RadA [Clostridia bacterium]